MASEKQHDAQRRRILRQIAGTVAFAWPAAAMAEAVCYNRATLVDLSMRETINFKDISPDAKRTCSGCAFFTATSQGCGKCQLLTGGPVTAHSVCDNWAART